MHSQLFSKSLLSGSEQVIQLSIDSLQEPHLGLHFKHYPSIKISPISSQEEQVSPVSQDLQL